MAWTTMLGEDSMNIWAPSRAVFALNSTHSALFRCVVLTILIVASNTTLCRTLI